MLRHLRVEYPGAIYKVTSRGDRQQDIYLDKVDRQDFLSFIHLSSRKNKFPLVGVMVN